MNVISKDNRTLVKSLGDDELLNLKTRTSSILYISLETFYLFPF